jgi:hypothetical protein
MPRRATLERIASTIFEAFSPLSCSLVFCAASIPGSESRRFP